MKAWRVLLPYLLLSVSILLHGPFFSCALWKWSVVTVDRLKSPVPQASAVVSIFGVTLLCRPHAEDLQHRLTHSFFISLVGYIDNCCFNCRHFWLPFCTCTRLIDCIGILIPGFSLLACQFGYVAIGA